MTRPSARAPVSTTTTAETTQMLGKTFTSRPRLPAYRSGTVGVPHQKKRPKALPDVCLVPSQPVTTKEPRQSLYLRPSRLNQRSEAPSQDSPLTFSLDSCLLSCISLSSPATLILYLPLPRLASVAQSTRHDLSPERLPPRCCLGHVRPPTPRSYRHCHCLYRY
jgi:hypothetical protein